MGHEKVRKMTLRDMMYMTVIAEEKSITKASSKLYVAQPALSQCVQKVEKELGNAVFVRKNNGVILTAEGECFIEFARKTLREQKKFEKKIIDLKNADTGKVYLGFTGTQATYVLPYVLPKFNERYPALEIVLVEAPSDEIENKLVRDEIEVGILHPPIVHDEIEAFEISRDDLVIVPRSNSRFQPYIYYKDGEAEPYLDIEFLREEPLVITKPSQRSRMVSEQIFKKAGLKPHIRQVTKSINTMDALAQVNYATALIPSKQVSEKLKRRGCYRIDPEYNVPYSFYAATRKDAYLSTAAKKLLEFLEEIKETF